MAAPGSVATVLAVGISVLVLLNVMKYMEVKVQSDNYMRSLSRCEKGIIYNEVGPNTTKLQAKYFNTQGLDPQPTTPMSLIIPCQNEDFHLLPSLLESIANQTVLPAETIIVLNLAPEAQDGVPLLATNFGRDAINLAMAKRLNLSLELADWKSNAKTARQWIVNTRLPLEWSMLQIPNLKIVLRAGRHYAGSNRIFGLKSSSPLNSIVSFFDCDDYLHPLRTEYVMSTFDSHPELDALVHGYSLIPMTKWDEGMTRFLKHIEMRPLNDTFLWPYSTLWKSLPKHRFENEPNNEPRQTKDSLWWFPRHMNLTAHPPFPSAGHNGWLTVKKKVLDEIEYPEKLPRGQDSLFNWRLIANEKNFNHLPLRLAAYIRPR